MEVENTDIKVEEKTTKDKLKIVLTIGGNIVFYAIIILLFLISIMQISSGGKNGLPKLFGRGYLSVQSDSMTRMNDIESKYPQYKDYAIGSFDSHDLVVVDILNDKERQELQVGDVITFWSDSINYGKGGYNTHRITYIDRNDDGTIRILVTQGDLVMSYSDTSLYEDTENWKKEYYDTQSYNACDFFGQDNLDTIHGKVIKVKKGMGDFVDGVRNNWLFIFVIPVAVILLVEVFFVFKNILDYRNEKARAAVADDKEAMMAELEAEKERMRQELLAELKAQQASETKTEEVVEETTEDKTQE